jgi:hypothetical protein
LGKLHNRPHKTTFTWWQKFSFQCEVDVPKLQFKKGCKIYASVNYDEESLGRIGLENSLIRIG